MKKWTVMLIPQGSGGTCSLTLCEAHFWFVSAVIIILAFTASFFFQRQHEMAEQATMLRQANRILELEKEKAKAPVAVQVIGVSHEEVRQMEARLRAEYEASINAINTELTNLYDMEAKARSITGLAPRTPTSLDPATIMEKGKGGGPARTGPFPYAGGDQLMRPPQVIYGMARPTADLILQEIRLRTISLRELVRDMEIQLERIERVPSGWPLARGQGRITSSFGYRLDPFTRRVRHHDGTDISAKKGTSVQATARGKVIKAEYISEYGNTVIIDHGDGIQTAYAHLSDVFVRKGDKVGRGDSIGTVGSTGRSTGNHLHYEVIVNGRNVNPAKYLTE